MKGAGCVSCHLSTSYKVLLHHVRTSHDIIQCNRPKHSTSDSTQYTDETAKLQSGAYREDTCPTRTLKQHAWLNVRAHEHSIVCADTNQLLGDIYSLQTLLGLRQFFAVPSSDSFQPTWWWVNESLISSICFITHHTSNNTTTTTTKHPWAGILWWRRKYVRSLPIGAINYWPQFWLLFIHVLFVCDPNHWQELIGFFPDCRHCLKSWLDQSVFCQTRLHAHAMLDHLLFSDKAMHRHFSLWCISFFLFRCSPFLCLEKARSRDISAPRSLTCARVMWVEGCLLSLRWWLPCPNQQAAPIPWECQDKAVCLLFTEAEGLSSLC